MAESPSLFLGVVGLSPHLWIFGVVGLSPHVCFWGGCGSESTSLFFGGGGVFFKIWFWVVVVLLRDYFFREFFFCFEVEVYLYLFHTFIHTILFCTEGKCKCWMVRFFVFGHRHVAC